MLVIKTRTLTTTMAKNDMGRIITLEKTSPTHYAGSMAIILTTSHKSYNSKG